MLQISESISTSSCNIVDEAKDLAVFFDAVAAKGIDVSSIRRVLDCVDEVEVKSRVRKEWRVSKAWRSKYVYWADGGQVLSEMMSKSDAYRELAEVLRKHKLRLIGFAPEDVLFDKIADPDNPSKKVVIPGFWGDNDMWCERIQNGVGGKQP